jgi:hypothetical protein
VVSCAVVTSLGKAEDGATLAAKAEELALCCVLFSHRLTADHQALSTVWLQFAASRYVAGSRCWAYENCLYVLSMCSSDCRTRGKWMGSARCIMQTSGQQLHLIRTRMAATVGMRPTDSVRGEISNYRPAIFHTQSSQAPAGGTTRPEKGRNSPPKYARAGPKICSHNITSFNNNTNESSTSQL